MVVLASGAMYYLLGNRHRLSLKGPSTERNHYSITTQGILIYFDNIHHLNTTGSTRGTFLPLNNIQGDIFVGMKKPIELFYFFQINDANAFKSALQSHIISLVTSAATLIGPVSSQPSAFLNIAFSQRGLHALGINDSLGDSFFSAGQWADAEALGDNKADWDPAFSAGGIDGVMLIASDTQENVDGMLSAVQGYLGESATAVKTLQGSARPGDQAGHEHFGYLDGISNPGVVGFTTNPMPGQSVVPAGIILTGHTGDTTFRPLWTRDGSFMVFRKLRQYVPEWSQFVVANAVQNPQGTLNQSNTASTPAQTLSIPSGTLTRHQSIALFAARLIGRWQSGAPVDLAPLSDDPSLGADPTRNNNFDYSHPGSDISSDQSRCPFSAHIRKTRPRADLGDSDITHQAIRAGIPYGSEVGYEEASRGVTSEDRGMAFVEYQSNIGNGFREQQVVWGNDPNFPPGKNQTVGLDPLNGLAGNDAPRVTFGTNPFDASQSYSVPAVVRSNGGEYFFMPSISALRNTIAAQH
uniref:DyP-type peroxidase n=1 Tax=Sistotrema brinkmannii TaxID=139132 RepID=A0A9E9M769_9AGAM|nr:DyP-type peroxidase [Sistotrema brinkmannii]